MKKKNVACIMLAMFSSILVVNQPYSVAYASSVESDKHDEEDFSYEKSSVKTQMVDVEAVVPYIPHLGSNSNQKVAEGNAVALQHLTAKIATEMQFNNKNNRVSKAVGEEKNAKIKNKQPTYAVKYLQEAQPVSNEKRTTAEENADMVQAIDASRQGDPSYISQETYDKLLEELTYPGKSAGKGTTLFGKKLFGEKINFDGELRIHSMINDSENLSWDRDRAGIRLRIAADTHIYNGWRIHTMTEVQRRIKNYGNKIDWFSRIYLTGYLGDIFTTVGRFGYLMADGNIYDSSFSGVRFEYADDSGKFKYTLAAGKTDYTSDTFVATVRYDDYDYSLEAGIYNYKANYVAGKTDNTIFAFSGVYNFNNYSLGAMYLHPTLGDNAGDKSGGYVLSATYGSHKTWRAGTYSIFAKYYNQPRHTYIIHGMEGLGSWMHGFKGLGIGMNYTFRPNLVGGLYYFDLEERHTGIKGKTLWTHVSFYF